METRRMKGLVLTFDILFNYNKTTGKTKHFIFGEDSNQPKS